MQQITLGSLFDGIGGWPLAASRVGIRPAWASEIEKFPQAVTAARFPDMLQLGDITQIDGAEIEQVDIICMGSPCQDLSVAGRQKGLKGEKSRLFYTAADVISRMRTATKGRYPRFVVWENVPGAFSSNKGMDFRAVLEALTKTEIPVPQSGRWAPAGMVRTDSCDIAWRVLDAQYWGVPQRRKRIFLVADFAVAGRCADKVLFERESLRWHTPPGEKKREEAATRATGSAYQTAAGFSTQASIKDSNPILHELTPAMMAKTRLGVCVAGFKLGQGSKSRSIGYQKELAPALSSMDGGNKPAILVHENHGAAYGIGEDAYNQGQNGKYGITITRELQPTLVAKRAGALFSCQNVRRLTPLECERLQGLPDNWTLIDDKSCSDTTRYKALGNGMAQPCADFIVKRIAEVMRMEAASRGEEKSERK